MNFKFAIPALAVAAAFAAPASAAIPVYSPVGTINATTYTFTADKTGTLEVYYLGGITVGYSNTLTVLVNGSTIERSATPTLNAAVKAPGWTSTWGSSYSFGSVTAGDTLVWKLTHYAPAAVAGTVIYSDPTLNTAFGSINNVFSADYAGGDFGVATGSYTYVAFEDITGYRDPRSDYPGRYLHNDYDYNDFRFAFNVVPEPATWAMLIVGFGFVGFAMRRRKATLSSVAQ